MAVDGGIGYLFAIIEEYTDFPTIANAWGADPDFPQCLLLHPNLTLGQNGTFSLKTISIFTLYNGDGLLGQFDLGNLPNGFEVTGIAQLVDGIPCSPQSGSVQPLLGTPFNSKAPFSPSTWGDWNTGALGLSNLDFSFDSATQGLTYLAGFTLTREFDFPADPDVGNQDGGMRVSATTTPVNVFDEAVFTGGGDVPYVVFRFLWSYDTDACAGVSPVTALTVVDETTGEISFTPGVGSDATLIVITGTSETEQVVLDSAITSYTPTLTGDLTFTLYAITEFPICKSTPVSISVGVTAPFIFTMGEDGITTGIFLGGAATLQFIGDPSGIYTIVPGKAYDTLYERIPTVTSQDVKIPDPFIRTALVGE